MDTRLQTKDDPMARMIRRLSSAFDFSKLFLFSPTPEKVKRVNTKIKIGNNRTDSENIRSYWAAVGKDLVSGSKKIERKSL